MWVVKLVKPPPFSRFRPDFFPRRCAEKAVALGYVKEVKEAGGEAKVERVLKSRRKF